MSRAVGARRSLVSLLVVGMLGLPLGSGLVAAPTQEESSPAVFVEGLSTPLTFENGGGMLGIATGDFNENGDVDLAVTHVTNVSGVGDRSFVSLLFGHSNGTFDDPVRITPPGDQALGGLAAADLNDDGNLDLAVAGGAPGALIYLGNGDGTFDDPSSEALSKGPSDVQIADLDADGDLDLVLRQQSDDMVSVLLNNGNGNFAAATEYAVGDNPTSLSIANVDGSPGPDLVVSAYSSRELQVLPNNGNGTFGDLIVTDAKGEVVALDVADFTGDGKPDAALSYVTGPFSLAVGDGDGTFTVPDEQVRFDSSAVHHFSQNTPRDVDADGDKDLVYIMDESNFILVGRNDGSGTFDFVYWVGSPGPGFASGIVDSGKGHSVYPADIDNDGVLDLIGGRYDSNGPRGSLSVLLGKTGAPGTYRGPRAYSSAAGWAGTAQDMTLTDFDGDGIKDLLAVTASVDLLRGNGDGTFDKGELIVAGTNGGFKTSIATADFDKDGNKDLIFAGNGGVQGDDGSRHFVGYGAGAGTIADLTSFVPFDPNWRSRKYMPADFNEDGYPDIAVEMRSCCGDDSRVEILMNDGGGARSFTGGTLLDIGHSARFFDDAAVAVGDFDDDGHLDVVTRITSDPEVMKFFAGNGDGTFEDAVTSNPQLLSLITLDFVPADIDGDGDLDLLAPSINSPDIPSGVYGVMGRGDGTFQLNAQLLVPSYPQDVELGDFNADGIDDMAIAGNDSSLTIAAGNGDGSFGEPANYAVGRRPTRAVEVGDLNGDGLSDVMTGHGAGSSRAYFTPLLTRADVPDLVVDSIDIGSGADADVDFVVRNAGKPIGSLTWTDSLYLSLDRTLDADDRLVTRFPARGPLGEGESYSRSFPVSGLAALAEGPHYVIVKADATNQIRELDDANNKAASDSTVDLTIPLLERGVPVTTTIASGEELYYRVDTSDGNDVVVTATFQSPDQADFLARFDRVPLGDRFDERYPTPGDLVQELPLGGDRAGTYYLALRGRTAAGNGKTVTLLATAPSLSVTSVSPDHGSNKGSATATIRGTGFEQGVGVSLVKGNRFVDGDVTVTGRTELTARFDLKGLPTDNYDVRASLDEDSAIEPGAFEVNNGPEGLLEVEIVNPEFMRPKWIAPVIVNYRNAGETDIVAPLLTLSAEGAIMRLPDEDDFARSSIDFFATAEDGPSGVLGPGEEGSFTAEFTDLVTGGHELYKFVVSAPDLSDSSPIDWDSRKNDYRPPYVSAESWDVIWERFLELVGETGGDYAQALGDIGATDSPYGSVQALLDEAIATAPGAPVSGRLRIDGAAVAGANMTLSDAENGYPARSASNGKFSFWDVADGSYELRVQGHTPSPAATITVGGGADSTGVEVELESGTTLTGTVTGTGGAAIEGAIVTVHDPVAETDTAAVTERDGSYSIPGVGKRTVEITVDADGYAVDKRTVDLRSESATQNFSLNSGASITGTVTLNGSPAPGVDVWAAEDDGVQGASDVTVADGSYSLSGLPAGNYQLVAESTDGSATASVTVTGADVVRNLVLDPTATLTGTVTDAASGAPLDGVQVATRRPEGPSIAATSSGSGAYTYRLPAGSNEVVFSKDGYQAKTVSVTAAGTTSLDVELAPLAEITGSVSGLGGNPVTGIAVQLERSDGQTFLTYSKIDGTFEFESIADGSYTVSLWSGYDPGTSLKRGTIDVVNGQASGMSLDLNYGDLTGAVQHADGSPSSGATVVLVRDDEAVASSITDEDGRFAFHVFDVGTFSMVAFGRDLGIATRSSVTVNLDQVTDGIVLKPGNADLTVSLESQGQPVVGGSVVLQGDGAGAAGIARLGQETGANGRTVFKNLPAGSYKVLARGPGMADQMRTVNVSGSASESFDLVAGQQISGVVTDGGQPVEAASVGVANSQGDTFFGVTDGNGSFQVSVTGPGPYDAWAGAEGAAAVQRNVTAGGSATLALVRSGGSLSGTVTDSGGQPVDSALVRLVVGDVPLMTTRSNLDGSYDLGPLPAGAATLEVVGSTPKPVTVDVVVPASGTLATNVVVPALVAVDAPTSALGPVTASGRSSRLMGPGPARALGAADLNLSGFANTMMWEVIPAIGEMNPLLVHLPEPTRVGPDQSPGYRTKYADYISRAVDCLEIAEAVAEASSRSADLDRAWDALRYAQAARNKLSAADQNLAAAKGALVAAKTVKFSMDMLTTFGKWADIPNIDPTAAGGLTSVDFSKVPGMKGFPDLKSSLFKDWGLSKGDAAAAQELVSLMVSGMGAAGKAAAEGRLGDVQQILADMGGPAAKSLFNLVKGSLAEKLAEATVGVGPLGKEFTKVNGMGLDALGRLYDFVQLMNEWQKFVDEQQKLFDEAIGADSLYDQAQDNYLKALKAYDAALRRLQFLAAQDDCPPDEPELPKKPLDTSEGQHIVSGDPNDIVGPGGVGKAKWFEPGGTLPYMIRYENMADVTAAAQIVIVTQYLDPDLDWNTFEFGDLGFAETYVEIAPGQKSFYERVDLQDEIGFFIDITGTLDLNTGEVTWVLETIDPATGERTTDASPDAGFLPPNEVSPEGEGFLNYTIAPKPKLKTGSKLTAKARIWFDTNDPIDTPVHRNTVDVSRPKSAVKKLPKTIAPGKRKVSWKGTDKGAGIKQFRIYVSVDGKKFKLWIKTKKKSAKYKFKSGHTYAFYSVATDKVGHTEKRPHRPDTKTH